MVDRHPEDAIVLNALSRLGASGERVDSGQLRRESGLPAARIRESVQRLRWKGKIAMDRLEVTGSALKWAHSPIPAATYGNEDRDAILRAGLRDGLSALELLHSVATDPARTERKIARVKRALALVAPHRDAIIVDQAKPAAPIIASVPVTRAPVDAPISEAKPVVAEMVRTPPRPAPSRAFKPWVEDYMRRVRDAVEYLNGRGFGVVRASVADSTWKVVGWTGLFDNDQLIAFADSKRAEATA